jgi:cystathionine beta-lyase
MSYNFDVPIDRRGTNSLKWEFMKRVDQGAGEGTLPFWVADMDFPCADPIIEALHARVDRRIFGYSSHETPEYFGAVRGWYRRRFGWEVESEAILFSPGIVPAINYLVEILTKKGDPIIIQRPVYYPFSGAIEKHGRRIVNNPLRELDGRYEMDYEDLERKASESGARLLILSSPHNPVGRVWAEEELAKLVSVCERHGITIISDEIHYDLIRRGARHHPLETVAPGYRDKIITATSPSKTFNLAGMQLSNIVVHDPELRKAWKSYVGEELHVELHNALAIEAAEAAFDKGEPWLEELLDYLDGQAKFLGDFLAERLPGARYRIPEGTYLAWIDLSAYCGRKPGASDALVRRLSREAGVMLEAGSLFGPEGEGYVRLNFACPRSILAEGLERVAAAIEKR